MKKVAKQHFLIVYKEQHQYFLNLNKLTQKF